ncbi:hypothetical protein RvY_03705 [Ramazzottius varieornatus]|uniref:G-protein coupled receptors family 1 profile domain-containing protein n=1 Tax=Ramazzottius varieornatus TaxID=947166 RepID=A0A1D1UW58_RAMVA|nr:hypothetical protein RvY_03705 [Ramazzottius varieornatus]
MGDFLSNQSSFSSSLSPENFTLPADMRFNEAHRVQIIGYSVLMSISAIENLTVLLLLAMRRPMSRMNMLLVSLTVSDLLVTFLTMPLEIAWAYTVQWLAPDSVCKIMMVGRIFGLYSSSFNLVAISIDRFCVIMYPFTNITSAEKRVRGLLLTVWLLSAACSLPQAVVFRKQYHPYFATFGQCATFNSFPSEELEMAYNVFVTLMLFVIPLILFCIFYGRLWWVIRRRHILTTGHGYVSAPATISKSADHANVHEHAKNNESRPTLTLSGSQRSRHSNWHHRDSQECPGIAQLALQTVDFNLGASMRYSKGPNIYMRAQSKSFKMAVTLVIVYLVCWVPYYLVSCWFWFDKESLKTIDPRVQSGLFIFAVSQSCLNPIVTGVFCLRLDKKIASLYCCRKSLGSWRRKPTADFRMRPNSITKPRRATPATAAAFSLQNNRSVRTNGTDKHNNYHYQKPPKAATCVQQPPHYL